jgi:hypothetical protein
MVLSPFITVIHHHLRPVRHKPLAAARANVIEDAPENSRNPTRSGGVLNEAGYHEPVWRQLLSVTQT